MPRSDAERARRSPSSCSPKNGYFISSEHIIGQSGVELECLYVPYSLEFEVVDSHYRLRRAVEGIRREGRVHEHGYQRGLPVVAVDYVWTEADNRQYREHSLAEEGEALDIPLGIGGVRIIALEVILVVNEIELDAVVFVLHDAYVNSVGAETVVHVEVCDIFEVIPELGRDTGVVGENDPHVKLVLVDILRERADNVGETACLDEGYAFGSGKKYVIHSVNSNLH